MSFHGSLGKVTEVVVGVVSNSTSSFDLKFDLMNENVMGKRQRKYAEKNYLHSLALQHIVCSLNRIQQGRTDPAYSSSCASSGEIRSSTVNISSPDLLGYQNTRL